MMIDWRAIKHFNPSIDRFSEDPNKYADPGLIAALDEFRHQLGRPVHPSPVSGALARFDNKAMASRHYAVGRKSDAIDVFCEGNPGRAWLTAMTSRLFGGIGIYFDTQYQGTPSVMLHLDTRPLKGGSVTYWARTEDGYFYPKGSDTAMKELFRRLEECST